MNFRNLQIIFAPLAVVMICALNPTLSLASSLERMEAVLKKADSLEEFLQNPALIEEYYQEAQKYYGEGRFPKSSFNALIGQVKILKNRVPEVGERLWETTKLGKDFSIDLAVPISGLEVEKQVWDSYLKDFKAQKENESSRIRKMQDRDRIAYIESVFQKKGLEIDAFEKQILANAPRAEKGRLAQEFYRSLLNDSEIKEIAAYLIHTKLNQTGALQSLLHSGSADGILFAWNELRKPTELNVSGIKVPDYLQKSISEVALPELQIPKKLEVIEGKPAHTSLFRVAVKKNKEGKFIPVGTSSAGEISFKSLPRRFHGIFKGVSLGECVGGHCDYLYGLTPERWATIALNESRIYQIEKNGKNQGFIQLVPVQVKGETYGSLEFGSPFLANNGIVVDKNTGKALDLPFTTALTGMLKDEIPDSWKGILVSSSNEINNANILDGFRKSDSYINGIPIGRRSEVVHSDPLAKRIVDNSPRLGGHIATYGGNMIVDASLTQEASLKEIDLLAMKKLIESREQCQKIFSILGNSRFQNP